jgi:hypothetical protein
MDVKVKTAWVKALRSGKFKQGDGQLYDGQNYCCLGVLAQVQGAAVRKGTLQIGGKDVRKKDGAGEMEILAPEFACGLHTKTQNRLAAMNDGIGSYYERQHSFEQIADFIEKRL